MEDRNAELNQSTDLYEVLLAKNIKLITQLNTQKQAFARVQKQCDFEKKDADRLQEALFAKQDKAVLYLGERDEALRSKEELETQLENQNVTHKATVDNLIRDFQRIVPDYNPYHVLPRMPRSQQVTDERSASVARTGGFVPRALHRTDAPGTAPLEPPTMGRGNQPGDTNSLRSRMPAIDPYIAPARTQRGISATSGEASTTAVSSTSRAGGRRRMTLPELKEFNGSDEDAYEKWRQLLLQKMEIDLDLNEGYSEAERQALLRTKVSGDAYELVKDQEMVTYMDWVEILDDYYGNSADDKVQRAHADFSTSKDGPLAMKKGETVREWKVRFQRAANRVNYPEELLFQHVRKLVMTPIYNYA